MLLEFPDQEPSGEAATALVDLAESDTIRLYDILAIRKDADGTVSGFEVSELGGEGTSFATFEGARSGCSVMKTSQGPPRLWSRGRSAS